MHCRIASHPCRALDEDDDVMMTLGSSKKHAWGEPDAGAWQGGAAVAWADPFSAMAMSSAAAPDKRAHRASFSKDEAFSTFGFKAPL